MNKNWKAATLAVQGGYEAKDGEPRVAPIVQSTTYRYDTTQSVADLFDLKRLGDVQPYPEDADRSLREETLAHIKELETKLSKK